MDDELRFHIDTHIDELIAAGSSPHEARRIAEREFGDLRRYRDAVLSIDHRFARETHMRELLESITADLRHALRALYQQPGFALVAIVTLAVGIGATTAVFSAVSGVLLRPFPYANAERIVHLGERDIGKPGRGGTTSYDNFADWRRLSHSFAAIGLYNTWQPTLTGRGDPLRVEIAGVTAGIFDVLSVKPVLGRAFIDADNADNAAAVAVVSDDFWRAHLSGDPAIVGQNLIINAAPVRVVGILPPGFVGPRALSRPIWINFSNDTDGRGGRSKNVLALLKQGVSTRQAQEEMTAIASRMAVLYPKDDRTATIVVDPLADLLVGDLRQPLYLLLAASGLVLLIACANLSNLLLSRGVTRSRELAIRTALGASRTRVVRQLLTESLVLAAIGCSAGIAVAAAAMRVFARLEPGSMPGRAPAIDWRVIAVTAAVAVVTTLMFGLFPALRTAPRDPQEALRDSGDRGSRGRSSRARAWLAVTQLSLAVALLSASAMVIKSFLNVLGVQPGLRPDHLLTLSLNLPRARYDSAKSTLFYDQVERRLAALPDVRGAAVTSLIPFSGDFDRIGVSTIAGEPERHGSDAPEADRYIVSPSYFATMGVRLLRGRLLSADDGLETSPVCLVDEVFARRTWGEQDPIGKRMKLPLRAELATVVGVTGHVKTYGLDADSPGQIYMSNAQYPWRWMSLVVRTAAQPEAALALVTKVVHGLDRDEPIANVRTMDALMAELLRGRRFALIMLATFAAIAMTLAVIGLYGVVAYGVTRRQREFGIRMALGARQREILRLVVGEGMRMAAAGGVIGCAIAVVAGRVLTSFLFGVGPYDAAVLSGVTLALMCVAILACLIPARRAARLDCVEVLRAD